MFFWKFTRSGKYSDKYISLIIDFHDSLIDNNYLKTNFEECKDILILIHDVEHLNGERNYSAGLQKQPFQQQVNRLGFKTSNLYVQQRKTNNLVLGQMTLGTHGGTPLDYGESNKKGKEILLNILNLNKRMMIDARTGIIYREEDKLKAYRNSPFFINRGFYFDLMPKHECIVEIVNEMLNCDVNKTLNFLKDVLKWEER